MFGSKTRQITKLQARIDRLTEQRDYHQHRADTAQAVTNRTAAKFTEAHDQVAFLNDQANGYQGLLTRHRRLLLACVRYREEGRLLRAAHRRELRAKADQLEAMQRVLDRYHARDFDEAKTGMEKCGLTVLKPAA
jgi:chromosome segregation ATPase